jgi:hypothetical protein
MVLCALTYTVLRADVQMLDWWTGGLVDWWTRDGDEPDRFEALEALASDPSIVIVRVR